ncbi:MAG: ATP-binding cassette domain-containing protein [Candidatus Omnitrophica bacterium]|nr:ATP-binding cassette domain-containing protein [Candidatus Omnitrophota bacterium]MDE2008645.1 ATP-binding cassette domain-containing protein [Candidatus Omnitrophota bacterium]
MIRLRLKRRMHTPQGQEWIDVDLNIDRGEFVALFGKSAAGKTTLLRMLAGLTRPQEGYIEVDGEIWFDSRRKIDLPVQQRRTGFVFQDDGLFPHMTVRRNLEYACGDKADHDMIYEWTAVMGLKGMEDRKPSQLSGGQKRRVALARALLSKPKMMLLDEPLSGLDLHARLDVQDEIIKAWRKTGITTILVSHDLSEVFKMSQKIFVIEQGRITASGSPQDVFINRELSGKFRFTGQIIDIQRDGVVNILTLCVGNHLTKVVAGDEEISGLAVGSRVIVAAKAFNPLILKV